MNGVARASAGPMPLDFGDASDTGDESMSAGFSDRGTGRLRPVRGARRKTRADLAGTVHVRHAGRDYRGWYRVAGDLLTVYCGIASNTGLVPDPVPSPTPFAERLLRALIEAEHPGINPE